MISLDANILVYSVDMDDSVRQNRAIDLISAVALKGGALTEQSIMEFANVSLNKMRLPLNRVRSTVADWLANFRLFGPNETIVNDTFEILARSKLSVWDARMLAVCASNGCRTLFSEDMQDGAIYGGVRVINPFVPKNAARIRALLG